MALSLDDLTAKVDNGGVTPDGLLTAEEYNALLAAVKENAENSTDEHIGSVVVDNTLSALDLESKKPVDSQGIASAIEAVSNSLKARGYIYMGVATPTTTPDVSGGKVFYLAAQAGEYTNFGYTLPTDALTSLEWDGERWFAVRIADLVTHAEVEQAILDNTASEVTADGTKPVSGEAVSRFVDGKIGKEVSITTLADYPKRDKGVFVAFENGEYTITPTSTSWKSWVIPNEGINSIEASLGSNNTALQCCVVFLRDLLFTTDSIIGHKKPISSGSFIYQVEEIPIECRFVLLSNRKATLTTPSATISMCSTALSRHEGMISKIANDVSQISSEVERLSSEYLMIDNVYITQEKLTKFSTYSELINAYDALMSKHSTIVSKTALGEASDGQTIYEYTITNGNYNKEGLRGADAEIIKPLILLEAGIHGYEPESNTSLYIFIKDLLDGNLVLSKIRDNLVFKVIPCANPYGYDNNRRGNANNVDINRNFDADWQLQGDPTANPSYYGGASAASEPETQILQQWLQDNRNGALFIDFHNSSYFNEISCIGGANEVEGMEEFKKNYLTGVTKLSSYLVKYLGLPDTSIWCYTYTSSLGGSSGAYRTSLGIVGGVLETSQNVNNAGENSPITIAVGANVLGTLLLNFFDVLKN